MKALRIGWISLGLPSAKRLPLVVGIGFVILLWGLAVLNHLGTIQGQASPEVMHTRLLMSALGVAQHIYEEKYGHPAPVDPVKFLAVIRGENVDGLNSEKVVFLEISPHRFNAREELLDGWKRPYMWDTHPPEGKLAIWSRGRFGWLSREEAMHDIYYEVLIE